MVGIRYLSTMWLRKDAFQFPVLQNPKEADELIGCIGWGLTDDEIRILDNAAGYVCPRCLEKIRSGIDDSDALNLVNFATSH